MKSSWRQLFWTIGIILALGVVTWFLAVTSEAPRENPGELTELKNEGLIALESGDYDASDAAFLSITQSLPSDPLGPRNLTISRVLALIAASPQQRAAAIERVDEAVELLRRVEPDSPSTYVLASRAAQAAGNESKAYAAMATAADVAPDDAGVLFELYTQASLSADSKWIAKARGALRRAYELAPDNLSILIERLLVQADEQDAAITITLESARRVLAPFVDSIRGQTQVDLHAFISQSTQTLLTQDENRWSEVSRNVRVIANLLRPEIATRLDRKRLIRNELEYMLTEFSVDRGKETLQAQIIPGIPVKLEPAGESQQFPELINVRAVTLADLDLDGQQDLLVARDQSFEVYVRSDPGWILSTRTGVPIEPIGIVTADFDRDSGDAARAAGQCETADLDVIVFGADGIFILENQLNAETGQRAFVVTDQAADFRDLRDILAAAVADLDHDGDLDLAVSSESGMSLWSNYGDMRFADISDRSMLPEASFEAITLAPVDWNRTIDIDIVLAGAAGTGILENHRHGRFRWRAFEQDESLSSLAHPVVVGDFDSNVSWDAIGTVEQGISVVLTQTLQSGSVRPRTARRIETDGQTGIASWDYDNDGYLDLLTWGDRGIGAWRGAPDGNFAPVDDLFAANSDTVRYAEPVDVDGDGDQDVVALEADRLVWYSNQGGNENNWMDIALSGQKTADQKDERVNIHGIGSQLELKAGSIYQRRVVTGLTTHFGLGQQRDVDVARVLWTNGIPQNEVRPAGPVICATQILKGSCPYLYTWSGSRYEFATDLLWASPIGLQTAENVLQPAREWEYLKIDGEQLEIKDGEYRVQITEELWEAAYFDHVSLVAVDHPPGTSIYTNEKVGPAEIALHKVHTVRNRHSPVAAVDHLGRDVLPEIERRDGRYLKGFERRQMQGLVDPHYLELDLGRLESPQQIVMFLTGWVFPTDTSLNIAISQNPNIDPPQPPSLWVPNEAGEWQMVRPYIGFPGGKTKTIAVDISDAFVAPDYRLRIATSMEIYWDEVFFTVDDEPVEVRLTELPLLHADVHYRGFSRRVDDPGYGPESYDYTETSTAPKWPPLEGSFTRYGDVTMLLRHADDRLVVIGAGDEISLRFKAPVAALPDGWTRDFILHNIGWDKDADLNTVYGDLVEPLPFAAMQSYPDALLQGPRYANGRQELHTGLARIQDDRRFWHWTKDYQIEP